MLDVLRVLRVLVCGLVLLALVVGCRRSDDRRATADTGAPPAPEGSTIALDVAKSASSGDIPTTLAITLAKDKSITVDGRAVSEDGLRAILRSAHEKNPDNLRAVLNVDGDTPHGEVIRLIDIVKQSGISEISLGTQRLQGADR